MKQVITIQNVYTKKTQDLCEKCIARADHYQIQHGLHAGECDVCSFNVLALDTDQIVSMVEPLCQTRTFPENETTLHDWVHSGSYDGSETPQSLAEEWDRINALKE